MTKYPLKPLTFRILIQPKQFEEKTGWGFQVVSGKEEQSRHAKAVDEGKILKLGPAAGRFFEREYDSEWPVKEGDYVLFKRHHGEWWQDPKSEIWYVILNDEDIMCILDSETVDKELYKLSGE